MKCTVRSSRQVQSNLKTIRTPSTGTTTNAFADATTNTDTPSHHLVFEASPTAATGSREDPSRSPFVFVRS
jgi:hypothetical protein